MGGELKLGGRNPPFPRILYETLDIAVSTLQASHPVEKSTREELYTITAILVVMIMLARSREQTFCRIARAIK